MDDEEETCRICRSGEEEDAPLRHPCRCKGSLAMVHQDCLVEWLQHSQKKSCELCNTELRFHKIYSPSMPSKLPKYLYARRFLFLALQYLRFSMRAMFVAAAWLALLPLGNIYIWRLHFWIVDVLVWGIIGGVPPSARSPVSDMTNGTRTLGLASHNRTARLGALPAAIKLGDNSTLLFRGSNTTMPMPLLPFERLALHLIYGIDYRNVFDSVAHDTFEGQILTCVIVVVFVAIFLLREWCMQNLPQQVQPMIEFEQGRFEHRPADAAFDAEAAAEAERNAAAAIRRLRAVQVPALQQANNPALQGAPRILDTTPSTPVESDETDAPNGEVISEAAAAATGDAHDPEDWNTDAVADDVRKKRVHFLRRLHEPSGDIAEAPASVLMLAKDKAGVHALAVDEAEASKTQTPEEHDSSFYHSADEDNSGPSRGKGKAREAPETRNTDIYHSADEDDITPTRSKGKAKEGSSGDGAAEAPELETREADRMVPSPSASFHGEEAGVAADKSLAPGDETGLGITDNAYAGDATATLNDVQQSGDETASDTTDNAYAGEDALVHDDEVAVPALADGEIDGGAAGAVVDPIEDWENDAVDNERIEDDIEGMMEAIGMRGPVLNLFTNITLMFVLCSFTLTVSVALPYMMGRLAGVRHVLPRVALGPATALHVTAERLGNALASDKSRLVFIGRFLGAIKAAVLRSLRRAVCTAARTRQELWVPFNTWSPAVTFLGKIRGWRSTSQTLAAFSASVRTMTNSFDSSISTAFDRFALAVTGLEEKTRGTSSQDKAFCIALGHSFWLTGLAIQSALSHLFVRWNMRSLKMFVDQQIVVLKVLSFILLELVAFPLCCGILFDIALFPLWDGATLQGRFALAFRHPLTVAFTLWSVGTLYMFVLAQFVGHTRSVVRPGLLCFVRDPGDPTFHPIKDILERRSIEQLRKIGLSGLIYSYILTITFGICARAVAWSVPGVLPLQWDVHQSVSSSALDLLCIATILPLAVGSWLPAHWVRRWSRMWWQTIASSLRMSEYLMGTRREEEEGYHGFATWGSVLDYCLGRPAKTIWTEDGSHARVPNDDIAVMSAPLIVRTNERGEPLNDRGWDAVYQQREGMKKMAKKPVYALVYMPSNHRLRIATVIVALWASLCIACIGVFIGPLLLGRYTLLRATSADVVKVHDGLTWTIGFSTASLCWSLANKTRRMYKRLRVSTNAPRRFYKHAARLVQRVWLIASLCGVLGGLQGIVIEVYFNALMCAARGTPTLPDVSVLHTMVLGILSQYLLVSILALTRGRALPPSPADLPILLRQYHAWRTLRDGGWRRPPALQLTRYDFVPVAITLVAAIMAPLLTLAALRHATKTHAASVTATQVSLTFALYAAAFLLHISRDAMLRRIVAWTDDIKDEHFLLSTELRNYASQDEEQNGDVPQTEASTRNVDNNPIVVDGPIPDVVLHAAH